jgi:hypothetical protein
VSNEIDAPDSHLVCQQRARKRFEKIAFFKMAPFKLKFRMGGLRSTSQETNDTDPQNNYNENLTNNSQTNLFQFGSSTTIDSHEVTGGSTGSLNNDQRALLHSGDDGRIGNKFVFQFTFELVCA